MLLQRLCEYADRELSLPSAGYQERAVRYLVDLDPDGVPAGLLFGIDTAKDKRDRGTRREVPNAKRSGSKPIPLLLADTAWRTFALPNPKYAGLWIAERHAEYVALVRECAEATGDPAVAAVAAYLDRLPELKQESSCLPPEALDAHVTWRVDGQIVTELPSVRAFWAARMERKQPAVRSGGKRKPARSGKDEVVCMLCGGGDIARIHPVQIKGIPGGKSAKELVSADKNAYKSYGLANSFIAPVCRACAEKYANALNALLANKSTCLWTKHSAHVFWTAEGNASWFLNTINANMTEQVRDALRSVRSGNRQTLHLEDMAFYALGLGASGSRVAVRSWLDTTVGTVIGNIERYFDLQQIADSQQPNGRSKPLPLSVLVDATMRDQGIEQSAPGKVRKPRKDAPSPDSEDGSKTELPSPGVEEGLLALAMTGRPLPMAVVLAAVRRCRATQGVTLPLAALIKLGLGSQPGVTMEEREAMKALDETSRDPAYVCGRLLSILDSIQREAVGPKATLVDRYFGAASATPALVFGPLMRNAQNHLGKLRKTDRGAQIALENRLTEAASLLGAWPATLGLQGQATFALGFYHQKAADEQARKGRRAANEATEAEASGEDES